MPQDQTLTVELVPVSTDEKITLANLTQLYRYDASEFNGDEPDTTGCFSLGSYFDAYWREPERYPFFIHVGRKLGGFVLARQLNPEVHSVAEFFVMRRYRRQGVGARAATLLFETFPGEWHVAQDEDNLPAQHFWRAVIDAYTGGNFTETYNDAQPKGPKQVFRTRPS